MFAITCERIAQPKCCSHNSETKDVRDLSMARTSHLQDLDDVGYETRHDLLYNEFWPQKRQREIGLGRTSFHNAGLCGTIIWRSKGFGPSTQTILVEEFEVRSRIGKPVPTLLDPDNCRWLSLPEEAQVFSVLASPRHLLALWDPRLRDRLGEDAG
jgi:hypothetical protein